MLQSRSIRLADGYFTIGHSESCEFTRCNGITVEFDCVQDELIVVATGMNTGMVLLLSL